MNTTRTKEKRRKRIFVYQGNRLLMDKALGEDIFLRLSHPNRVMRQFRLSNRRRAA
jgi:hypothetical protein